MAASRGYELAIRLSLGYGAIIVGTALLFIGMTNTTVDGQPFSYPFFAGGNFIFWSAPSLAAALYLNVGKYFRILSWGFIGFLFYWLFHVFKSYTNGDLQFMYWHQGDVVCMACDNRYFSLAAAAFLFGVCVLAAGLARSVRDAKAGKTPLPIGAFALFLLLFSAFVVGIS